MKNEQATPYHLFQQNMRAFYRRIIFMLLALVCTLAMLAGVLAVQVVALKDEVDRMQEKHVVNPLQAQLERDRTCAAWLFNDNLERARRRICKK